MHWKFEVWDAVTCNVKHVCLFIAYHSFYDRLPYIFKVIHISHVGGLMTHKHDRHCTSRARCTNSCTYILPPKYNTIHLMISGTFNFVYVNCYLFQCSEQCWKILNLKYWTRYTCSKAVPLQVWSGPESFRNVRFSDFMKTAQDGGKIVSLTHRPPLPPRNTPGTHFC